MGAKDETGKVEYHNGFYGAVHAVYEPMNIPMEYMLGTDGKMAEYVSAIIRVSAAVNDGLFRKTEEESTMSEAIERIFSKEFDKRERKAKEEVVLLMLQRRMPVEDIKFYTKVPMDRIITIAKDNGLNAVAV